MNTLRHVVRCVQEIDEFKQPDVSRMNDDCKLLLLQELIIRMKEEKMLDTEAREKMIEAILDKRLDTETQKKLLETISTSDD